LYDFGAFEYSKALKMGEAARWRTSRGYQSFAFLSGSERERGSWCRNSRGDRPVTLLNWREK